MGAHLANIKKKQLSECFGEDLELVETAIDFI